LAVWADHLARKRRRDEPVGAIAGKSFAMAGREPAAIDEREGAAEGRLCPAPRGDDPAWSTGPPNARTCEFTVMASVWRGTRLDGGRAWLHGPLGLTPLAFERPNNI
jgi:hypothetical protein